MSVTLQEIGKLTGALNSELKLNLGERKHVLSTVSHELINS